ncbi:MAG: hypothetical protein WC437_04950 [Patescibacteria group bacterium]|jgi:hypothetical protein
MALTQVEASAVVMATIDAIVERHLYNDVHLGEDPYEDTLLATKDGEFYYIWNGIEVTGEIYYVKVETIANYFATCDPVTYMDDRICAGAPFYEGYQETLDGFTIVETFGGSVERKRS